MSRGYILFYLNREFYELNFSAFNSMFDFPPSLDLDGRHVLRQFNRNTFWYTLIGNYQYDAGHSKGTIIGNPCIEVAQRVLARGLFAQENSLNMPRPSELYFLHSMLEGTQIY